MIGGYDAGLVANFITVLLLAVVGGVVLWLHMRLDALQENSRKLPILAEQMTHTLLRTQKAVAGLKKDLLAIQPEADGLLIEARKTKQELVFVLDKTAKTLDELDRKLVEAKKTGAMASAQKIAVKADDAVVVHSVEKPRTQAPVRPAAGGFKDGVAPRAEGRSATPQSQAEAALRAKVGAVR